MLDWNALSQAGVGKRVVVWVGPHTEPQEEVEKLFVVAALREFDQTRMAPYRADLVIVDEDTEKWCDNSLKKLAASVHDDGAVWVRKPHQESVQSEFKRLGFYSHPSVPGLFKRVSKVSPKAYDADYLGRWGSTDFMSNWSIASQQILSHAPKSIPTSELRILDVGSFNGYMMESLRRAGVRETFGVEISYDLAVQNSVNRYHLPSTYVADFLESRLPAKFFDMTIAMEILEHIEPKDTASFVAELARVTKDDGVLLISASEDWDADPTHINCRKRPDWYFQFAKAGLVASGRQTIFPGFNSFVLKKSASSTRVLLSQLRYGLQSAIASIVSPNKKPASTPGKVQ